MSSSRAEGHNSNRDNDAQFLAVVRAAWRLGVTNPGDSESKCACPLDLATQNDHGRWGAALSVVERLSGPEEGEMKHGLAAGAVILAAGGVCGGLAHAAQPDNRGCPSAYQVMTVEEVLEVATPGFEGAIKDQDANGDDLLCVKLLPEPIPLFEPTFLYYDNNRHP